MSEAALNPIGDEDNIYFTNLPVGEILRRTRLHYNRSLEEIEKTLRIRAEQLAALEDGRFEELPAKVYAIGFVRSYAEYLGLDGEKMVHLFKTQAKDKDPEQKIQTPVPASDSKLPSIWLIVAAFLTVLVIAGIYSVSSTTTREIVEAIPEVPEEMLKSTVEKAEDTAQDPQDPVEETAAVPEQDEGATLDAAPETGIVLNIVENSWVEIRAKNTGRKLLSQVLKAGDQYFVPDRPDLVMSIGNAGGVEIRVDGEALRMLGGTGIVRRNIPLDGNHLKAQYAKPLDQ